MSIIVRDCVDADLPTVLEIHNEAVLNTTAIWNYAAADLASRRQVLADRRAKSYPFFVAEVEGEVAGYASFGDFRPHEGYHRTVEHSIYIDAKFRGRGIAAQLLPALMTAAENLDKHVMIGAVDATNTVSIRLHQKFGFVETGRLPQVGYKFGRYLDLLILQKILGRD